MVEVFVFFLFLFSDCGVHVRGFLDAQMQAGNLQILLLYILSLCWYIVCVYVAIYFVVMLVYILCLCWYIWCAYVGICFVLMFVYVC